jgi:UDP-N-acetyl-2-amino-2-deoxyglucuronate dehydrogenase
VRIGIIGAGGISQTHVRAALGIDGVRIAAVHGVNADKTRALAATAGAPACADLDAFFRHPMDMVAIGSPSGLHAEHARAAVARGIHVLVEKPLDTSTGRIDALLGEADRAGVVVGVFFQERLVPEIAALKERVDSGKLGTPIFASGQVRWYRPPEYYSGSRWRGTWALDGGGALMNQGIHTLDLLLWLLGPLVRVSGRTATRLHEIEVEDTAVALLEFASGALATLEATTAAFPGFPRRLEVIGTQGSATHEDPARPALVGDATPHRRVLENFIDAVRNGSRPACDGRDGRRSVAAIEAIYRSSRSGHSEEPAQ